MQTENSFSYYLCVGSIFGGVTDTKSEQNISQKTILMFFEPKITKIEHDFQIFVVPLQQEN
jgi:hypothetical protein